MGRFLNCKSHVYTYLVKSLLYTVNKLEEYNEENIKTLDDVAFILMKLDNLAKVRANNVFKDISFMTNFNVKMDEFMDHSPKLENCINILYFIVSKYEQFTYTL
jgi:hypothetical protein